MLRNPDILRKVQEEIRPRFTSYEQVTQFSTQNMPYTRAVLTESMRIFPPLPIGLPRVVPQGGDTVDGHFVPENVSCCSMDMHSASLTMLLACLFVARPWCRRIPWRPLFLQRISSAPGISSLIGGYFTLPMTFWKPRNHFLLDRGVALGKSKSPENIISVNPERRC
jgi:hypothetical protein